MKRLFCVILLLSLLLCSCTKQDVPTPTPKDHFIIDGSRTYVAPCGEVPAEFQEAIDGGLLKNAVVCQDRIFNTESLSTGYKITMYDLSFRELGSFLYKNNIFHYRVGFQLPTTDGGMLLAANLYDHYISEDSVWASELGYRTEIVKFDARGMEEFRYSEDSSWEVDSLYETESGYLVLGTVETPETRTLGVVSPSDVYLLSINKDGTLKDRRILGGDNFDSLLFTEHEGETYILYSRFQSEDGTPKGSGYHKTVINEQLEISDDTIIPEYPKESVGTIDGEKQYNGKGIFQDYPDGWVLDVIDYGDFYLVMSLHITGTYENQPLTFDSIWEYKEMVYSAYAKEGNVLWIATEDISPDYDALRELYK